MSTIKKTLAAIFTIFLIFPAFSYSKKDLLRAVQSNDDSQVKKILSMNSDLSTASYDSDKNSILMIALENSPSDKMIEMLLRAGCSPDIKNKNGQTALMIACKNNLDDKTLEKIINFNTFTKIGKVNRILLKDKDGKCCFDYTTEGSDVYKVLTRFTEDPSKIPPKEKKQKITEEEPEVTEEQAEEVTEEQTEEAAEEQAAPESMEPEEVTENTEPLEKAALDSEETVPEVKLEEFPVEAAVVPAAADTAAAAVTAVVVTADDDKTEEVPAKEIPLEETEQEEEIVQEEEIAQEEETVIEENIEIAEESAEEETPHSVEYDETVNVPKVDYYNKNRPEYLFDEIESETIVVEEKTFKKISNPNAVDNSGRTKLMNAIMNSDLSLCYSLLESGAKIDIRDKDGFTALMYSCRYSKNAEIVELLFNYGAKLNDKNTYNLTVLQITAAYCESVPVLQVILNHAKEEKFSLTEPFVTALKTERPQDFIRQFIKFIPNINKSVNGKTPLMYAAENYESTDVIKLLLENGADPYIISTENKNAFSYAKENTKIKHDSIYWSLNVSASRKR